MSLYVIYKYLCINNEAKLKEQYLFEIEIF